MRPAALACALVAIAASVRVARADDTAALAYQQAEQLANQGKWAEACPLYEASYRADPEIGVLLHLADCHERIGRLASAWAEFNDAVDLAQRKHDNRAPLAKGRADALKPRLAYLHLVAPAAPVPGLLVRRDGLDVTVLVGTDMPIDPGDHQLVASAPGYVDWKQQVTIGAQPTVTQLAIPPLEKVPVQVPVVAPPKVHQGKLEVTSQADAHIAVDGAEVGVGRFAGTLQSGGHQLRVTAPGMRPYQSEIVISDDETRTVEVPLDRLQQVVYVAPAPREDHPSFEAGFAFAPGVKGHGDDPAVLSYRADIGLRLGRRVELGLFAEYASVSASGSCGTDIPGPAPASPYDFGTRDRFESCSYAMAGLELFVHVRPAHRIDPYIGIAPGFRFGFLDYRPYYATGMPASDHSSSQFLPGIAVDARAGVDYHPRRDVPGWAVGGFLDVQTMVIAEEQLSGMEGNGVHYVSFFGGLRTSLAF